MAVFNAPQAADFESPTHALPNLVSTDAIPSAKVLVLRGDGVKPALMTPEEFIAKYGTTGGVTYANALPALASHKKGETVVITNGDLEGQMYLRGNTAWEYQTQLKVPLASVMPSGTSPQCVAIANSLPVGQSFFIDYANGNVLERYRVFSTGVVLGPFANGGGSGGGFTFTPVSGWIGGTNREVDRAFDANNTSQQEIADLFATLVEDFKAMGFLTA